MLIESFRTEGLDQPAFWSIERSGAQLGRPGQCWSLPEQRTVYSIPGVRRPYPAPGHLELLTERPECLFHCPRLRPLQAPPQQHGSGTSRHGIERKSR